MEQGNGYGQVARGIDRMHKMTTSIRVNQNFSAYASISYSLA